MREKNKKTWIFEKKDENMRLLWAATVIILMSCGLIWTGSLESRFSIGEGFSTPCPTVGSTTPIGLVLSKAPRSTKTEGYIPKLRCLIKGLEKYTLVPEEKTPSEAGSILKGLYYWADDGCVLGHMTKDAATVFSLLEMNILNRTHQKEVHVVLGNKCARRDLQKGMPMFREVIVHWFRAIASRGVSILSYDDVAVTDTKSNMVCFEKLILRPPWRWFRMPQHAVKFRRDFLAYFGVAEDDTHHLFRPDRRLNLTVVRRLKNRNFREEALAKYLGKYLSDTVDVRVVVLESMPSYTAQIHLLATTDILVAAHGAALANSVALRPLGGVVELFGHNFRYLMFEELIHSLGLAYYGLEAREVSGTCCQGRPERRNHYRNVTLREAYRNMNGRKSCKNCNIAVSDDDVLYAVRAVVASVVLQRSRESHLGSIYADRRN